jgi:hypothetical protein
VDREAAEARGLMPGGKPASEILIEIVTVGAYAKVTAIDPATGSEASVTVPANTDEFTMKAAARRKLEYVMRKLAPE